jgi:hypothetical protein
VTPPPIGEGMHVTIGSGRTGANARRMSDGSFMSEETFDHDPALDKEYGSRVELYERRSEDNWPLPGPGSIHARWSMRAVWKSGLREGPDCLICSRPFVNTSGLPIGRYD